MAAESSAEGTAAELALSGTKLKKWNVATKEGFLAWQMRMTAFLASKSQYMALVGIQAPITAAEYAGFDPSFALASPSAQQQTLREANSNLCANLNTIYLHILGSIEMTDDPAFERVVAQRFAPDLAKLEPAKVWDLLDALNAKGARTTRGAQDELEEEVNEYKPPYDATPAAMARSLKHIVQSFEDLEINAHAPPKRVMEWLIKLLRAGPGSWATYFATIEIDFVKSSRSVLCFMGPCEIHGDPSGQKSHNETGRTVNTVLKRHYIIYFRYWGMSESLVGVLGCVWWRGNGVNMRMSRTRPKL